MAIIYSFRFRLSDHSLTQAGFLTIIFLNDFFYSVAFLSALCIASSQAMADDPNPNPHVVPYQVQPQPQDVVGVPGFVQQS
jgi:hypothetical protein